MTDHPTDRLGNQISDALDDAAGRVPVTAPPAFSWQSGTTSRPGDHRRAGHRRAVFAGSALVAAGVAAALVVTTLGSGDGTNARPPQAGATASSTGATSTSVVPQDAASILLAAAHTALRTGDPVLADGQYRYVRTVSPAPVRIEAAPAGSPASAAKTTEPPAGSYSLDELWIPKDENDVWLRRSSVVGDPADADDTTVWKGRCGDLYANTQDGPKGDPCTRPGNFEDTTPAFIAALPRDATELYRRLHHFAEGRLNPDKIHDVHFAMFTTIDDLLVSGMVTSDLTSTLYTVLSRIPGIAVVPGAKNAAGVAGTGFRLSTTLGHGSYTDTSTIIVDTGTGAYLGDRDVTPDNDYLDAVSVGVADTLGVAPR